jgi:protein CpxP
MIHTHIIYIMSKVKLLSIAVVVLMMSNFFFLAKAWLMPPPHRPEPKNEIIETLGFNDSQTKQFEALIALHQINVKSMNETLRNERMVLYAELNSEGAFIDSILDPLMENIRKIEALNYKHFIDIKGICNSDQIDEYEELTKKLADLFMPKPPREL